MTDPPDVEGPPMVIGSRGSAADRMVVLVRHRPGVAGETQRTVHVIPLPTDRPEGVVEAVCGAVLAIDHLEVVDPGEGMPCLRCVLTHTTPITVATEELCVEVMRILAQRRCAPAVLAHPYATAHRIVITGERYGVPLPWPAQVHRVTGVLRLPPAPTSRGSITWTQPPRADSLSACREIDLFGALRTALSDFPSESPPVGR